jgi:hypothetical protein
MAIDLKKMKAKMAAAQNNGKGGKSDFWKLTEGEHTVRILPSEDGDPFKEYHFHYNVGKQNGFLCPKRNFGDDCPVCNFATKLFNQGDTESIDMAKKMFARQRFFSPVMVRGEEKAGVRVWGYSKTVYQELLSLVLNPDFGDITDADEGVDLLLKYAKDPGMLYPKTSLTPRRKSSPLCEDEDADCQELISNVPDFDTLFERKTTEEVGAILDEAMNSELDAEANSEETSKYKTPSNDVQAALNELM